MISTNIENTKNVVIRRNPDGVQYGNLRDADFDNSGFVNYDDFGFFLTLFGKAPGPTENGNNSNIPAKQASCCLTQPTFGPTLEKIQYFQKFGQL